MVLMATNGKLFLTQIRAISHLLLSKNCVNVANRAGKIPKDRSWKQAKMMMAKVDAFLDALINYDKEHIHSDVIKVDRSSIKNFSQHCI